MKKPLSTTDITEPAVLSNSTAPGNALETPTNVESAQGDTNNPPSAAPPSKGAMGKFDPARLRLSANYSSIAGVKKHILVVPIRKPTRFEWVQFHSDEEWRIEVAALVWKEERESFYVVDPELWNRLSMDTVPILLISTVNAQGAVFLTPIRLPGADGRQNEWHRSLLEAALMGMKGSWIRIAANLSVGGYEVYTASGELGVAAWPEMTFDKLLATALHDQLIDTIDHPVLKRLRGES